jgi:hypothetical protein
MPVSDEVSAHARMAARMPCALESLSQEVCGKPGVLIQALISQFDLLGLTGCTQAGHSHQDHADSQAGGDQ